MKFVSTIDENGKEELFIGGETMTFRHLVAYMPTYLHQLWHCVWFAGLIGVYLTICYKVSVYILSLDIPKIF